MDIVKLLEKLTQINSVSGNEGEIREFIAGEVKKYCDELTVDAMGNLTARKKGTGKRIMFAAHADEIGIIVTDIDEKGFIRFSPIGGLDLRNLVHLRVCFANGTKGVIEAEEEAFKEKPSVSKLYIDIGADSGEDARKHAAVGDTAAFEGNFEVREGRVFSKALDNRAGCAVLIKALSEIGKTDNDLYFVFTVQEEAGLRGAKTAAYAIEPDIAFAVDVTDTGDIPSAPVMAVKLGGGAAIKVMDRSVICDAGLRAKMMETAEKNKIPYQPEIMTDGGTDAGAIHLTRAGVKTGGISVPTRYIHSPSETASTEDIENCARLVRELAVEQW